MNLVEELLSRRWVLRSEDERLYYSLKDNARQLKRTFQDKFGYSLIINPYLIKLEKVAGKPEGWMGIQAFESVMEYRMFCMLLVFLEEKDTEEVFVLSTLTEHIQTQMAEGSIDWLDYVTRRQLVRVVRFACDEGLILEMDGDAQRFVQSIENEVLYRNTGISRYIMRDFAIDIMDYHKPEDFLQSEWLDMEEDRGIVRKQRVYRRLLLSCGISKNSEKDEDMSYVRNYRRNIEQDFQSLFHCRLDVHSSSAYVVLDDDCMMGDTYPKGNALYDLLLLIQKRLRDDVKKKKFVLDEFEQVHMRKEAFTLYIEQIFRKHEEYFPKTYRERGKLAVSQDAYAFLYNLGFIEEQEEDIILLPIMAKMYGSFQKG